MDFTTFDIDKKAGSSGRAKQPDFQSVNITFDDNEECLKSWNITKKSQNSKETYNINHTYEEEEKVPTRTVRIEKQVRTTGSNNDFAFDDPAIIEIGDELLP